MAVDKQGGAAKSMLTTKKMCLYYLASRIEGLRIRPLCWTMVVRACSGCESYNL